MHNTRYIYFSGAKRTPSRSPMHVPVSPTPLLSAVLFLFLFFSGHKRNAFQKLGIKTAPHVYLIPRGIAIPTEPKLSDFEFTRGLSKPDGNLDDFLHDFTAITGSEVRSCHAAVLPCTGIGGVCGGGRGAEGGGCGGMRCCVPGMGLVCQPMERFFLGGGGGIRGLVMPSYCFPGAGVGSGGVFLPNIQVRWVPSSLGQLSKPEQSIRPSPTEIWIFVFLHDFHRGYGFEVEITQCGCFAGVSTGHA